MAAVTSTSTRAPIYKAFARRENIGDVTAKGECISNIADLVITSSNSFHKQVLMSLFPPSVLSLLLLGSYFISFSVVFFIW